MSDTRLSVRVDNATKKNAEDVFKKLGMTMSAGINIFLTRVAQSRSIPFKLELESDSVDIRMRDAVKATMQETLADGAPVARYDDIRKRPYLEYPDGRKVYEFD